MQKTIKILKIIIGIIVVFHSLIFIALIFQDQLIFRGEKVSADYKYKILVPHEEYTFRDTINDVTLHNVIYKPRAEVKGYIFYLHGTLKNVEYQTQFIPYFTDKGYAVWMMDYRGYGKSRGKLTEAGMHQDALLMYQAFLNHFKIDSTQTIICARSLGTGFATQLAAKVQPSKLVLISPYYSLPDVFKTYVPWFPFGLFMHHQFNNYVYLPKYKGPLAIFQGENDLIIPSSSTEKLQIYLKPGDEYHEYPESNHINIVDNPTYQKELERFLKK